jgi:DNA-binding transcriptional regulator YbjK
VRAAARAEQLRARGIDAGRIAARLDVPVDALAGYFAVQDELVEAAR